MKFITIQIYISFLKLITHLLIIRIIQQFLKLIHLEISVFEFVEQLTLTTFYFICFNYSINLLENTEYDLSKNLLGWGMVQFNSN